MFNRRFALFTGLATVLSIGVIACGEDPQAPTDDHAAASTAATAAAATYIVKDLGTLGGTPAWANGLNDHGGVVGQSALANGRRHAFLWRAGTMRDLGALAGGTSEASDINNNDVVVGWSTVASGAQHAARWQNGKITNLGTLGGRNSVANAINDLGIIVGWSETKTGSRHAFVWQNGTMRDLGTLGGDYSEARDINSAGKIVGGSTTPSNSQSHAVTWKNGVIKDLGTRGRLWSGAFAINTKGQIAALLGAPPDTEGGDREAAFPYIFYQGVWTSTGGLGRSLEVHAINDDGLVAGSGSNDETGREQAWVSSPGGTTELPSLTPGGLDQNRANDINSFGTVVGYSADFDENSSGPTRAVIWRLQ